MLMTSERALFSDQNHVLSHRLHIPPPITGCHVPCAHPILKEGVCPPETMAQSQKQSPFLQSDKEKEPELFEVRVQYVKILPQG